MRILGVFSVGLAFALAGVVRADDAAVKELLDQAIKAAGGADKAASLNSASVKTKAKISMGGMDVELTGDLSLHGHERIRFDMTVSLGGMVNRALMVVNGDKMWGKDSNNNKVEEAPKEVVPVIQQVFASLRMPGNPAALLANKDVKLAHGGEAKVNDVAVSILRVSRKDRPDINIYFDKKTGLAVKCETQIKEPDGGEEKAYQFHFSEFKEVNGVKHFGRVKIVRDGMDVVEVELSEFKFGEKFEANAFDKP